MAPVRRYLRITKYSVLECRIYLDNPSLAQSWLLNPRNPVLPRIVDSIRPLVLPKLREEKERERNKKKSSKKKTVKDVIVQDDFEVSMFLTETSTRHSLLSKQKHFREKAPRMMQSNSTKLISETNDEPIDVDASNDPLVLREEESDDDKLNLAEIPLVGRPKRQRNNDPSYVNVEDSNEEDELPIEIDSDGGEPASKRVREAVGLASDDEDDETDDKKKMAMDVTYEGFAIYGRVLCLVVRKRENKPHSSRQTATGSMTEGQARMENWITSTQVPVGEDAS